MPMDGNTSTPCRIGDCGSSPQWRQGERMKPPKAGMPTLHRAGRAGQGQNAGQRSPMGRTKRLTFTEGRLRLTTFDYVECKAFDFGEDAAIDPMLLACPRWDDMAAAHAGTPNTDRVERAGHGRHPSCARKGQTKGLSLTERRLSFAFAEGTPRPEAQVFRLTARGD